MEMVLHTTKALLIATANSLTIRFEEQQNNTKTAACPLCGKPYYIAAVPLIFTLAPLSSQQHGEYCFLRLSSETTSQ